MRNKCWSPLIVIGIATWFLEPAARSQTDAVPIEICDALESTGQRRTIRGLGRISGQGVVLVDMTCPVYESAGRIVGTLLRASLVTPSEEVTTIELARMRDEFMKPLFQFVVSGRVYCKSSMTFTMDASEHPTSGSGYGESGLVRCIIEGASLIRAVPLIGPPGP